MRQRVLSVVLCVAVPACSEVIAAGPASPPADAAVSVAQATTFGACVEGARDANDPVLTLLHDGTALSLAADGSVLPLHRFAGEASVQAHVQSREGFTLLHVSIGAAPDFEHRIALLDPAGRLAWEEVIAVHQTHNPFRRSPVPSEVLLGAQGRVAYSLIGWPGDRAQRFTRYLTPDGARAEIADRTPLGPPDATGRVMLRGDADGSDAAWWTPATATLTPVAREGEVVSPGFAMGDATVRYVTRADGIFLARELDGREDRVRLDFVTSVNELSVSGRDPEPWLLFSVARESPERTVHRLNLRTMALDTLTVTPPGERSMTMYSRLGIDGDGAILGGFRDAQWGQLFRSADGQRWEPLGRPTTGALSTFISDRAGGSYVIVGTNARYGGDEWPETVRDEPLGLRGTSLQIARPADGVSLSLRTDDPDALEPADVTLSPTGRCAAWVGFEGARHVLHLIDVNSGARRQVDFPDGASAGLSSFAWRR